MMHRARVALAQWLTLLSLSGLLAAQGVSAQSGTLTVQVDRPGAPIPETLFGLFFEDINFAADGGLYPERVKNRSFEFPEPLMGWVGGAGVEVVSSGPPAGTCYVRLAPGAHLISTGFRGIGLEKGEEYTLTFLGRGSSGSLEATLSRGEGTQAARIPVAQGRVRGIQGVWKRHSLTLRPNATVPDGSLILSSDGGPVSIDAVSLYPKRTFKNRKNGLRPDLVQLLADLKPGFLRFPGGCIVE